MADLSSYINITANTVTTANLSATGNVSSNSVISTTGNITGAAGVFNDGLSVTGNITATGNLNYQDVNNLVVGDPLIYIGANNTSNLVDLGIIASANVSGLYQHLGIVRNHSTGVWGVFGNVVAEPTTVVDWANAVYQPFQSGAATFAGANINGALTGATTISASANIAGNYFIGNGAALTGITVSGSNPVSTTGNVAGGNLIATGTVSATGNIYANYFLGNVALANGFPATYGNSNVTTLLSAFGSNAVSTTGNISSGYFIGNGSALTSVTGANISGSVSQANYANTANAVAGANVSGSVAQANYANTANAVAGANVSGSVAQATYANTANAVAGANVSGTVASATTAGTVTGNAQANITSVGTLSSLSVSGNITGSYILGNGSQLTGLPATYGNSNVATLLSAFGSNTISTTGNVTSGNLLTGGILSVGGDVTIGGNLSVAGNTITVNTEIVNQTETVTGNVTAGNVLTAGLVSATGNVTGNYILGNGSQLTGIAASYGDSNVATLLAAFGSNTVSTSGNITAGNISTTGNISVQANSGIVSSSSNIVFDSLGQMILNPGYVTSSGDLDFYTNSLTNYSELWLHDSGNAVISTGGAAHNWIFDTAGNLSAPGSISTAGNVTAGQFIGNGSALTSLTGSNVSGTVANATYATSAGSATTATTAGTVTTNAQPNITSVGTLSSVSVTANVTGGNVLTGGIISSTGNITGGNISATAHTGTTVSATGNITGGNILTGGAISAGGNLTVGNLITGGSSGNIFGANNISANSFTATYTPGSTTGSGILSQGANTQGGAGYYDFLKATNQSGGATNPNKTFRLNSTGGLEIINSAYTATLFSIADNGNAVVQGNLQVTGTLTYVSTTNLNVSNALITLANAATTPAQANGGGIQLNGANANIIYTNGNDSWNFNKPLVVTGGVSATGTVSATGNITGGNISATNHTGTTVSVTGTATAASVVGGVVTGSSVSVTGTATAASTVGGVITGTSVSTTGTVTGGNVATGGTATATGNITGGNVLTAGQVSASGNVTGNYILGNGVSLTGVITSVANINSGTSNVTVVSSGGNITVGVGGTANVVQFATTGEYVTGVVSATGNVTGGNVLTGGAISSTGNITGGNISATNHTGTTVSVSGTVTSASVVGGAITGSSTSVTGTATAASTVGGVITGSSASVTGTVTASSVVGGVMTGTSTSVSGNVLTGGIVSATGNITGGNISATNHTGTTASVSGNITGGNVLTSGQVSATGNITTANSFIGNLVGTTVSTTGNVTAGNVIANNIIVNGQSTTYGVVTPAYMVVGLANSIGSFGGGSTFILDTVVGNTNSQTSYNASTGVFTLTAGVTYDMSFTPSFISFTNLTGGFFCYDWVDATTNALLDTTGIGTGTSIPMTETSGQIDNTTARVIYKPTTNQTVKLRVTNASGTATLRGGIGTQAVIKPLNPTIAVQATATGTVNAATSSATLTSQQTVTSTPTTINFQTVVGNIPYNSGVWTLTAGMTYQLTAALSAYNGGSYVFYNWVDASTGAAIGNSQGYAISGLNAPRGDSGVPCSIIYTPSTNQTVAVRNVAGSGTAISAPYSWATVVQIGTTFALNALDTMTTTGNVTVGGNLSVTGNITSTPVGFRATTPVTNMTVNNGASATMLFGTEEVDTKNCYDPATGRFTPNVAGYYAINWYVVTSANGAGELYASLIKNGVLVAWGNNQTTATAHWNGMGGSVSMLYLNGTTDYISITLTNSSGSTATVLAASGLSCFSAYLIR